MSIKLYDGMKLRDSNQLWEFRAWVVKEYARLKVIKKVQRITLDTISAYDSHFVGILPDYVDTSVPPWSNNEETVYPLSYFFKQTVRNNYKKIVDDGFGDNPEQDSIIIFRNDKRNETYLYPFFRLTELEHLILESDYVDEFGYWNNSDELEGVTPKEWADRLRAWEEAVDLDEPLRGQGLEITFKRVSDLFYSTHDYLDYVKNPENGFTLPSFSSRVDSVTR